MQKRNNIRFDIPKELGTNAGVEQLLAYNVSKIAKTSKRLGKEMETMQKTLTPQQAILAAKEAAETRPDTQKKRFSFGHGKMTKPQAAQTRLLARADMHEWAIIDETFEVFDTMEIEEITKRHSFPSPRSRAIITAPRINQENQWVYYQNPSGTIRWMVQPDGCVYINAFVIEADRTRHRFLGARIDPSGHITRSCWRVNASSGQLDCIIDFVDAIRALEVDEMKIREALLPVFENHPAARIRADYVEDEGGRLWVFLDDEEVAADIKMSDDEKEEPNVRFFADQDGLMDPVLLRALEPRINDVLESCGKSPLDLRIDG